MDGDEDIRSELLANFKKELMDLRRVEQTAFDCSTSPSKYAPVIGLRMERELVAKLKVLASKKGHTLSSYIRKLVRDRLKEEEM